MRVALSATPEQGEHCVGGTTAACSLWMCLRCEGGIASAPHQLGPGYGSGHVTVLLCTLIHDTQSPVNSRLPWNATDNVTC